MALAQFRNEINGIDISKRLGAPKKQTMLAWFKAVRKMIPEVPNPEQTDWQITHEHADLSWIKFEMHNSVGERCYIIIDRKQPFIGAN